MEEAEATRARPGHVYLVGAGPGDPELITVRGADICASADVVLHDELIDAALLRLARTDALVESVGKRGGTTVAKQAAQRAIETRLVEFARSGRSVCRLKGGDPFLFGRGSEEVEALVDAAIPFEIVPGVCSPLGAAAYAGISLTHRDVASSVTFVSATTRGHASFDWSELGAVRGTVCVLMGMHRLDEVADGLVRAGWDPATACAVIEWGTLPRQRVIEAKLGELSRAVDDAGLGSPGLIVIGAAAASRSRLRWFDRRPLFGKRVLVTRGATQAAGTARLVRSRGAEPIELPTIELVEPPDPARVTRAVRELSSYDVIAFTSENGVAWTFREIAAQGGDARALGRAVVAAIGPGTAAALRARGVRPDVVAQEARGEGLADAIVAEPAIAARLARAGRGGSRVRVLILRALVAREVLVEILQRAGCEVDVVAVYETRRASLDRRAELVRAFEEGRIDVVMLTSSSIAEHLCDMLGPRAAELCARVLVASIGPITTAAATRRGLAVGVSAAVHTVPGMVEAIEETFASHSRG